VTAGPAAAMRNSAPGDSGWPRSRATPPNSHRVMPSMRSPSRTAHRACPSSWASTEAKNSTAAAAAMAR
jgi:hypothetical protein